MDVKKKEFVIPTKTEYLEHVRNVLREFIEVNCDFDSIMLMRITLAIDEVVSNVMEHAHKFNSDLEIRLESEIDDGKIVIKVFDQGGHDFVPEQIDMVDLKEHIDKRKKRGLGWFIIRSIMDEVKYEHLSGGGNLLTMVKEKGCKNS